ncbi:MAG: SH3 domain-containing protein [Oscillospiraceae bacterium]|nr:SH3 domain-containing protein [Oscillospiraceae bacterium]MBR0392569.1 SH3 domain-containing protein [Oscillospiraceae bacterium]
MATNKTYIVVKDGEELKEVKSLAAAKKLADAEGGTVVCNGSTVYPEVVDAQIPSEPAPVPVDQLEVAPEKYTLTAKMNIRTAPSLKADKAGVADAGTIVEVLGIEDDWLRVRNDAGEVFILYGSGKYARKN